MTSYVGHDADHSGDCCHRHQDEDLHRQEHQHHQRLRLQDVGHQHQQNQDDLGHQDHRDGHQDHQVVGQAQGDLLEERDVKNQEVEE